MIPLFIFWFFSFSFFFFSVGLFSVMECDIVAVDIFIRVTMVKFLYSAELLANYGRFLRPIRLYSRPVVILQKTAFLKSVRSGASPFLIQLADSQVNRAKEKSITCVRLFIWPFIN